MRESVFCVYCEARCTADYEPMIHTLYDGTIEHVAACARCINIAVDVWTVDLQTATGACAVSI